MNRLQQWVLTGGMFSAAGIALLAQNINTGGSIQSSLAGGGGSSATTITCGDCPPGGIVGGLIDSTSSTSAPGGVGGSLGNDELVFPASGYLVGLGFCQPAAMTAAKANVYYNAFNVNLTQFQQLRILAIYERGSPALPCAINSFDLLPVFRGASFNVTNAGSAGLGAGNETAGWSAQWLGTTGQPMATVMNNAQLGAGATLWTSFAKTSNIEATEALGSMPVPYPGTASNLCVTLRTDQPATGSLVFTVRDSGVDTLLVATVPASGVSVGSIEYCDHTNTHVFAAGDLLAIRMTNNAAAGSANIAAISFLYTPTVPGRALIPFPLTSGFPLTASATRYSSSFAIEAFSATEPARRLPMPVPGTLQSLYCNVETAPANDLVVTVQRNGVPTSPAVTITITNAGGTGVKLGTGADAFVATDSHSMEWTSGAGAVARVSGCTAEYVYP